MLQIICIKIKKHILKIIGSRFLYFVAGMLIVSTVVVYAAWSDAQTGGSGKLTELNWNSLVTQLQAIPQTLSAPGNWVCTTVDISGAGSATAACAAGYNLISGGCGQFLGSGAIAGNFTMNAPYNNQWVCAYTSGISIVARAQCCK